jgi:hypothetical protein
MSDQLGFDELVFEYWTSVEDDRLEDVVDYQQRLIDMGAQRDCDGNWYIALETENLLEDCG